MWSINVIISTIGNQFIHQTSIEDSIKGLSVSLPGFYFKAKEKARTRALFVCINFPLSPIKKAISVLFTHLKNVG